VAALFEWAGVEIRRNDFTRRNEINGRPVDDDVVLRLIDQAHRAGLRVQSDFMYERVRATALHNQYHPVIDYFDSLKWDGEPRLDTWLHDYLGSRNDDYTSHVGALALIAAVRRVRKPGEKFDTLLVLEGVQGTGKSTAVEILAKRMDWYTNNVSLKYDGKLMIEQTLGKLIVEVPELTGMNRSEVEHVKALLSRSHDAARLAYGRETTEVGRQFIMIGTVNVDPDAPRTSAYLKDPTGNRRFWPVLTNKIKPKTLRRDIDQLWAEAVCREAAGEALTLPRDLWDAAARNQKRRMESDPYYELLHNKLGPQEEGFVPCEDVWEMLNKKDRNQTDQVRIARAMKALGFEHGRRRVEGVRLYCYSRGDSDNRLRR
jgi:predicted P-loop ATPase